MFTSGGCVCVVYSTQSQLNYFIYVTLSRISNLQLIKMAKEALGEEEKRKKTTTSPDDSVYQQNPR